MGCGVAGFGAARKWDFWKLSADLLEDHGGSDSGGYRGWESGRAAATVARVLAEQGAQSGRALETPVLLPCLRGGLLAHSQHHR